MIISNKQVVQLYLIAIDSLKIAGDMAFTQDDRNILVNDIINQQSDKLVDLEQEEAQKGGGR